ncbi:PRD domain-containing protein [Pseudarthrobacter sp. J75]|uniref:PRD domain-containing protein n=1 Tax=unclassified Pseudarthrobacter TaxID=2647000 RepID=UPI002E808553|nr:MULTISPECIES: PRD domain-containing protein [unclassified Pseudarthrobacter]MEE2522040.1 PRD domain-containing protein [Pseudarthrobacter sp. J47]MEE2528965.1 PRD domain-containing protein [Pseudarthrobacter sp. J75]
MEILRVFNNNVVLSRDPNGREVILTGRGLGFQAKPGQAIDPAKVLRTFVPEDGRDPDNLGAMVAAIPPEHVLLAEQALEAGRAEMPIPSSTVLSIALADHLSFAIKRMRQGLMFDYPLRAEVTHLYPEELRAARRILEFVNSRLEAPLVEDEAVAIALHLVNAGFATGDLSYTYQMTGVFAQLFEVLEQAYSRPFDRNTVNAARFITHLRYFFVRANSGRQLDERGGKLRDAIRESYPEAHSTALKLQAVLELRLGEPLTEDEVTYLTLHVARMVDEDRT